MFSQTLRFASLFLYSPSKAAQKSRQAEILPPALAIYAAFIIGTMLFYWLKPWNFPDANASFSPENSTLWFWIKVMLWQPPLEAVWILLLAAWAVYFQKGSLGPRMILGTAWTAAPLFLIVLYAQKQGIPKAALASGLLAAFGLFYPLLKRFPNQDWKALTAFFLGLNVLGFIMLAPMIVAAALNSSGFFEFSQVVGGLWLLAFGTMGLRSLTGLRLPRAFLCVLFAMFLQIAFAFGLYFLDVVPKEILKALLYA